jgi:hypothetical protein
MTFQADSVRFRQEKPAQFPKEVFLTPYPSDPFSSD